MVVAIEFDEISFYLGKNVSLNISIKTFCLKMDESRPQIELFTHILFKWLHAP